MEVHSNSSILSWEIPWTEEPGGLQSMGSQRIEQDLLTKYQLQVSDWMFFSLGNKVGIELPVKICIRWFNEILFFLLEFSIKLIYAVYALL